MSVLLRRTRYHSSIDMHIHTHTYMYGRTSALAAKPRTLPRDAAFRPRRSEAFPERFAVPALDEVSPLQDVAKPSTATTCPENCRAGTGAPLLTVLYSADPILLAFILLDGLRYQARLSYRLASEYPRYNSTFVMNSERGFVFNWNV